MNSNQGTFARPLDVRHGEPQPRVSELALRTRIQRVRDAMTTEGLAALVVFGSPRALGSRSRTAGYIQYLAGWMSRPTAAALVLPRDGAASILTLGPHDTREFALRSSWLGDVIRTGDVLRHGTAAAEALVRAGIEPGSRIGLVGVDELPHPAYRAVEAALGPYELIDAEGLLDRLRLTRDPEEVDMLRVSARISDAMIAAGMAEASRPGASGPSIMAEVEHRGRLLGADPAACWLAVGEAPPTTYFEFMELPNGVGPSDRVQIGTTAAYEGYFGQCLRMGVRGRASAQLTEFSDILLSIQDAALEAMKPGTPLHVVSDVIESMIDEHAPYSRSSDPFRFQSCHGLGLSYSEPGMAESLSPARDRSRDASGICLEPNMVIEVHPNFTVPGLGCIVAGDMALVTAQGAEWITESPRGLWAI
ncbi:M24 family metallopeptidase [Sinomonas sp. JGH33]|uniref:M24 family metallopeptidase n=1 Tax=Sinomonas terricola TaxID=3110330 RepID=A0ABU5T7S4_9MICC|nr:M24 family metallopeptidase [Sinomonas sp. JGH33]MEA5455730.1 M24 family metallopeptidase [Sinomonas sp. JGH33]